MGTNWVAGAPLPATMASGLILGPVDELGQFATLSGRCFSS